MIACNSRTIMRVATSSSSWFRSASAPSASAAPHPNLFPGTRRRQPKNGAGIVQYVHRCAAHPSPAAEGTIVDGDRGRDGGSDKNNIRNGSDDGSDGGGGDGDGNGRDAAAPVPVQTWNKSPIVSVSVRRCCISTPHPSPRATRDARSFRSPRPPALPLLPLTPPPPVSPRGVGPSFDHRPCPSGEEFLVFICNPTSSFPHATCALRSNCGERATRRSVAS
jgi:hypothetical protein